MYSPIFSLFTHPYCTFTLFNVFSSILLFLHTKLYNVFHAIIIYYPLFNVVYCIHSITIVNTAMYSHLVLYTPCTPCKYSLIRVYPMTCTTEINYTARCISLLFSTFSSLRPRCKDCNMYKLFLYLRSKFSTFTQYIQFLHCITVSNKQQKTKRFCTSAHYLNPIILNTRIHILYLPVPRHYN
jgi:hypothetical protein